MRLKLAVRWLAVAGLVMSGAFGIATAQESTPVAETPEGNPSQYAFYPAEVAQPGGDLPGDPAVQLVKVSDGLFEPVNVAAPNDGTGRVFVVERGGRIRIVEADGTLLEEPFLDVSGETEYQFLEEGLLGLTFHPDFATNGLFYTNYTNQLRNGDALTVQYQVSADDPNKADPTTSIIVSERDQPFPNHIGGDIAFGPDGYLYIGTGDGGLEGDPLDAGQDLSTHLSKMLRIDVSPAVAAGLGEPLPAAAYGGRAYLIPPDNPFAQGDVLLDLFGATEDDFARFHPYAVPETWAFGLRNPWSFSFDRETGDLWIGDVGQNFWEEINMQPADSTGGENYGWKFLQGSHCFPYSVDPDCPHVGTLPVAEYHHDLGCTVVGGSVYRGSEYADLNGIYFHSDYCSGRVWGIAQDDAGTWQQEELLDTGLLVTGSGEDEAGNIYFTSCECGYGQAAPHQVGALWMLVAADQVPDGAEVAPIGEAEAPATDEGEATPSADASPADAGAMPATEADAEVESYDIYFEPKELTIPANEDVVIALPNNGAILHNFTIEGTDISVDFEAGEAPTVTVNLEPGTYRYFCDIPGHAAAGMEGELTVE